MWFYRWLKQIISLLTQWILLRMVTEDESTLSKKRHRTSTEPTASTGKVELNKASRQSCTVICGYTMMLQVSPVEWMQVEWSQVEELIPIEPEAKLS